MRLLTAIPLLFWTGTGALTHMALLWAMQPAPVRQARASEPAVESHSGTLAAHSVCRQAPMIGDTGARVRAIPAASLVSEPVTEPRDGSGNDLRDRILAAGRLSGNPPPARA